MHLIPLHIGDFSQATERFKPVHMGIFLRLLMEYYKSEKPLSDDTAELEWISGAESKSDKDALQLVLRRCFVHFPDEKTYRQKRADRELEAFRVAGLQKRHAILCRHWDSVNPGVRKPTLEEFSKEPSLYYDEATGRIRQLYARSTLELQRMHERDTRLPPPNYVPETSNQEPSSSNQSTPVVPTGTAHERQPSKESLAEAIYLVYPRKEGRKKALEAITKALKQSGLTEIEMQARVRAYKEATDRWPEKDKRFIPFPATWFNQHRFMDDPAMWERPDSGSPEHGFFGPKKMEGGPVDGAAIELGLSIGAQEPMGWRDVWPELYKAPCPAEWADVPRDVRGKIFDRLDEIPEATPSPQKKKGGAQ